MNAKQYLLDHSLDPDYITTKFGVVIEEDKITFPVYNSSGKLLYSKIRWLDYPDRQGSTKFSFSKLPNTTAKTALFCLHKIKDIDTVVLCEGEPDCLRLWQEGIPAITSTSGVKSFSPDLASPLSGKTIIICLDTDKAGRSEISKYCQVLNDIGATPKIIELPPTYKDVSEYFTDKHKKKDFAKLMQSAISLKEKILKDGSQLFPIVDNSAFLTSTFPQTKWLIEKLLRADGLSLLVGAGGVGKSLLSLSIAKAIVDGDSWLNKFPATQAKVLLIDKENSPIDTQKHLKTMRATNPNLLHFLGTKNYQTMNPDWTPTDASNYLKLYVEANDIGVIIMDSVVDFFSGSENDSVMVADNINMWTTLFPNQAILAIHHENKPPLGFKKNSDVRIRGSTHWVNASQSILSFSVPNQESPEKIIVEHTKVRGSRKLTPFEIEMLIQPDPQDQNDTVVIGFKYVKEVEPIVRKIMIAKQAIIDLLSDNINQPFTIIEMSTALIERDIGDRNIRTALRELRDSDEVFCDTTNREYLYSIKQSKISKIVDDFTP